MATRKIRCSVCGSNELRFTAVLWDGLVSEFGVDAWMQLAQAGFSQIRLFAVDYPTALSFAAIRQDMKSYVVV